MPAPAPTALFAFARALRACVRGAICEEGPARDARRARAIRLSQLFFDFAARRWVVVGTGPVTAGLARPATGPPTCRPPCPLDCLPCPARALSRRNSFTTTTTSKRPDRGRRRLPFAVSSFAVCSLSFSYHPLFPFPTHPRRLVRDPIRLVPVRIGSLFSPLKHRHDLCPFVLILLASFSTANATQNLNSKTNKKKRLQQVRSEINSQQVTSKATQLQVASHLRSRPPSCAKKQVLPIFITLATGLTAANNTPSSSNIAKHRFCSRSSIDSRRSSDSLPCTPPQYARLYLFRFTIDETLSELSTNYKQQSPPAAHLYIPNSFATIVATNHGIPS